MSPFLLASYSARGLSRISPAKIVELPICVGGEDAVPDGEGEEVDEHPEDVGPAGGGEDDEDGGEAEDEAEEDQGDGGDGLVGYCVDYCADDCWGEVSKVEE